MSEKQYDGPVEFKNRLGQTRYQPALATGERLYVAHLVVDGVFERMWIQPEDPKVFEPVLFRWSKAAKVSAREASRRERLRLAKFEEGRA